ncbi:serine hydrolase domain-containing protein [Aurantibacillus circumpalustris]|uniref:serine hydrolase domain-containing protein n=1 Tax=Aurantibacillus circumpalustris TaxID=3036359 RepID=UPI00295BE05B|nr:serine hydrolase [Aurantibacillus circumpalustris]
MKRNLFLLFVVNILNAPLSAQKANELKMITKEAYAGIPSLGSILVWKNNEIVCEEYFNGANDSTSFKVKSVTKSVVSALAGIANDYKLLPDLKTPIFNLFPEYATDFSKNQNIGFTELIRANDSLKRKITLSDLITMQTGYLWDDNSPLSSRVFNSSSDPVRSTLDLPFEDFPGTKFKYCTPASHVIAVIVSKSVKGNLKEFADSALFKPIGVTISSWSSDPLGRTMGGTELSMKSSDMIKFGLLYLNEGNVNGKQIISKSWINESTSEQVVLNEWDVLPGANGYGYYWWRRKTNGHQAFVASGYGGQLICVIPDLKMVIVTTCFVNDKNRGRSEIKRLHGFIDKIVAASM